MKEKEGRSRRYSRGSLAERTLRGREGEADEGEERERRCRSLANEDQNGSGIKFTFGGAAKPRTAFFCRRCNSAPGVRSNL